jgi:hypothetical protein
VCVCVWKSAEFLKARTRWLQKCSNKRALKGLYIIVLLPVRAQQYPNCRNIVKLNKYIFLQVYSSYMHTDHAATFLDSRTATQQNWAQNTTRCNTGLRT